MYRYWRKYLLRRILASYGSFNSCTITNKEELMNKWKTMLAQMPVMHIACLTLWLRLSCLFILHCVYRIKYFFKSENSRRRLLTWTYTRLFNLSIIWWRMRSAKEFISLESRLGTSDCHLSPLTVITVRGFSLLFLTWTHHWYMYIKTDATIYFVNHDL